MSGSVEVIFDVARDGWAANPWASFVISMPVAGLFLLVAGPVLQRLMKRWPILRIFGELPESARSLRLLAAAFVAAGPLTYVIANSQIAGAADSIARGGCAWIEGDLASVDTRDVPITSMRTTVWKIGAEVVSFGTISGKGEYNPANRKLAPVHTGDHLRLCRIGRDIWRVERIRP